MDASVSRFEEFKNLRNELSQVKSKLEERKVIDLAKGLLMKQRNLDENEAFEMLQTMAINRNMQLSTLSSQLIEAAKMLIV
jgi:two-component system, response regulator / RNA-binding antiterminator